MSKLATSCLDTIKLELQSNLDLPAQIGIDTDKEVKDILLSGLMVEIKENPLRLEANFRPLLQQWMPGTIFSDDLLGNIQAVIDAGINKWFKLGRPSEIIGEVFK